MPEDPFDLTRFVDAQDQGGTHDRAVAEIRAGRKQTHWMWFVLPQLAGLGRSATAQHFAISSLDEARAYVAHPVLGPRLLECCRALLEVPTPDAEQVLGPVDAAKLRSSMTLFDRATPDRTEFSAVLERFFDGRPDRATLDLLDRAGRE